MLVLFILYNSNYFPSEYSGEGNGTPLQYSCLENPMDRGAWWAAVCGVSKSWTRLSDFTFIFAFLNWRRQWQPTPVFLPGESLGRGSLVGWSLWGCTEPDTTEAMQQQQQNTTGTFIAWAPWHCQRQGLLLCFIVFDILSWFLTERMCFLNQTIHIKSQWGRCWVSAEFLD